MNISKRLIIITLVLFAALSVVPISVWKSDEKTAERSATSEESSQSMFLPNIDVDLNILENGDLAVNETITYDLQDSWRGLYRDIPLDKNIDVTNVQVTDVSTETVYTPGASTELGVDDEPQTFGFERTSDRLRIVWHIRESNVTKPFKISYTLKGQVRRYTDVAELTWTAWGDTSLSGVGNLNITATYPGRANMSVDAGGYQGRVENSKSEAPEMSTSVTDLPAHEPIEIRVLGDPAAISAPVKDEAKLKEFEKEQKELDEGYKSQEAQNDKLEHLPVPIFFILGLLFALPAGIVIFLIWKAWGAEKVRVEGYITQAPENITAPVIGEVLGKDDKHLFTAAILDLIRRKKIRTLPAQTGDTVDIALTYPVGKAHFEADYDYDEPVLKLVEWAIRDGEDSSSVPMGQLKWEDNDAAYEKIQEFKKLVEAHVPNTTIPSLSKGYGWRALWALPSLFFAFVGLALMIAVIGDPSLLTRLFFILIGLFFAANALFMMISIISGHAFWRYRDQDSRRIEWLRFENYFNELANMKDEQPASIAIWESLLVYATAFGKAELLLKNMRMPQGAEESPFGYRDGAHFHAMNIASISSLSSASSNVESQYASDHKSSSSGGSGGFSGGGGGGGTGGW